MEITAQYLDYVRHMEREDLNIVSEFLVMAATLLDIKAKMLLQVHDEIVLQVPSDELAAIKELVKETMESAIELAVPLEADENEGKTWYEAK